MQNVMGVLRQTVPISSFHKGHAAEIFAEVKRLGAKVVMKNNVPECVLLSPDEYAQLVDEINDARLLALATKRMANSDHSTVLSQEEVDAYLGITPDDLVGYEEVELE